MRHVWPEMTYRPSGDQRRNQSKSSLIHCHCGGGDSAFQRHNIRALRESWPRPMASVLPSGDHAIGNPRSASGNLDLDIPCTAAGIDASCRPDAKSQTQTRLPCTTTSMVASADQSRSLDGAESPSSERSICPDRGSQRRTTLSSPPEAMIFPFGDQASAHIGVECPLRSHVGLPERVFQRRPTILSESSAAIVSASGDQDSSHTGRPSPAAIES